MRSITGLVGHGATTIWLHRHSFNRDFGRRVARRLRSEERDLRIADCRTGVLAITEYTLEIAPEAKFANLNRRSWYPVV